MSKSASQNRPGAVAKEALCSLDEVKLRLGIGDAGLRQARRKGLPVNRIGKRGFVSLKELIDFVTRDRGDEK